MSSRPALLFILLIMAALQAGGCQSCKRKGGGKGAGPDGGRASEAGSHVQPKELITLPSRMNASHILISHKEAFRAPKWLTRTREQALAVAQKLAARVRKDPALLPSLARKFSEAPRSMEGGYLGNWHQGKMVRPFELAVAKLAPGAVTGPVETSFGFHIIRRELLLDEVEVSGAHLLIAHSRSLRAPAGLTRSRDEAEALAQQLLARLGSEPRNFEAMVARYSDGPRAKRGGGLGLWTTGRGSRPAVLERELLQLPVDAISTKLVETPFGFHLLKRTKISRPSLLSGAHLLISYKGAERAPLEISRTRSQARALARKLYGQLRHRPSDFPAQAKLHSDDASKRVGGDLGRWPRGQLYPAFEAALEKLKPYEISKPVETPFGFHLIRRLPLE